MTDTKQHPAVVEAGNVRFGNHLPLSIIAGPCAMESRDHALEMAAALKEIAGRLGLGLVYKSSFDKANRTSISSARGIGLDKALSVFAEVKEKFGLPVVAIGVVRADGTPVYGTTSEVDGVRPRQVASDRFAFAVRFRSLPLLPGHYRVRAHAADPEGMRLFDQHEAPFVVAGNTRELGLCRLPHAWADPAEGKRAP